MAHVDKLHILYQGYFLSNCAVHVMYALNQVCFQALNSVLGGFNIVLDQKHLYIEKDYVKKKIIWLWMSALYTYYLKHV